MRLLELAGPGRSRYVLPATLAALLCGWTAPAAAQTHEPAVSFHSLLRQIPSVKNGQPSWSVNFADILFAPAGNFTAKVLLKSGDETLAEFPATISQRVGTIARIRWKFAFTPLGTADGPRSLEVLVDDRLVGKLELAVRKTGSGDAFGTGDQFDLEGPWSTHGQLVYSTKDGDQQRIQFVYWAKQSDLGGPKKGMLELVMRRGAKVLATARPREISYPEYLRMEQPLLKPDGNALMAPDLAGMAGPFVVEVKHQGKVIRTFSGAIADGKFVAHERSNLDYADRTRFLSPREMSGGGGSLSEDLYTWVTTAK